MGSLLYLLATIDVIQRRLIKQLVISTE